MDAGGKTSTGVQRTSTTQWAIRKAFKESATLPVKSNGMISLAGDAELRKQAVEWRSVLQHAHVLFGISHFQWQENS